MIQHGVFAVSNLAVTTASASSANEARTRALALYRQWQKSVNIFFLQNSMKPKFDMPINQDVFKIGS